MQFGRVLKAHRDLLVDVALAASVTVVIVAAIAANLDGGRPPDLVAYLFAIGLGLLMLVRRKYPALTLVATATGLLAYYAIGYPPVGMAVPVAAALYSAAERGHLRLGVAVSAALILVSYTYRLAVGQDPAYLFGYDLAITVTVMAAALALGDAVRARRLLLAEAQRRQQQAASEREREAARRVEAERLRVARDVHDVLAHTVAVVSLQADVASEALADDPEAVRSALATIRASSSEANRQLRATVGLLRGPAEKEPRAPTGGLDDLDRLVGATAESGPHVDLRVEGEPAPLPVEVDTTAYRILQESLANALRHAHATRVQVRLSYGCERLEIEVTDDGRGAPTVVDGRPAGNGGLAGMRERAALLGGVLAAGNRPDGGFGVRASLPIAGLR
ncbi:MAG: sensor histidine kinase [Candidatus Dormibacteraeota bacterium]|nr:sensor histidine kinase [Candidatus Dormibacteraeota bacterium]